MNSHEQFEADSGVGTSAEQPKQFLVLDHDHTGEPIPPKIVSIGEGAKVMTALRDLFDLTSQDLHFPSEKEKARKIAEALNDPEVQAQVVALSAEANKFWAKKMTLKERIGL